MYLKSASLGFFALIATACNAFATLPWAGVAPNDTGSYDIPWLGTITQDAGNGWVLHKNLGWIYADGSSPESVSIYKTGAGWFWTGSSFSHYLYSYDLGGWVYYSPDTSSPQWFYDYKHKEWVRDLMNGQEVQSLDTMLTFIAQRANVPAIACAIVKSGKIIAHGQGGVIYNGSTTEVRASSRWGIGSVTKSMTDILAEKLVNAGLAGWDEKLPALLPDVAMNAAWNDVTLEDLAKHTAGLDDTAILAGIDTTTVSTTPAIGRTQITNLVLAGTPTWTPGSHYNYSSIGYMILAAALERRAGISYEEALVSQVLAPLGLDNYGFLNPSSGNDSDGQPWGHYNGTPLNPATPVVFPAAIPAGGVNLTIDDLATYIATNLAGEQGLSTYLPKADWTMLHYDASTANPSYAFGWDIGTYAEQVGPGDFNHAGCDQAFTSLVVAAPAADICIAMVTNEGNSTLAYQALYSVFLNLLNDYLPAN